MFKRGDKVICSNVGNNRIIKINSIYTVKDSHETFTYLEEVGGSFYTYRFILYNKRITKFEKEEDYYKWLADR